MKNSGKLIGIFLLAFIVSAQLSAGTYEVVKKDSQVKWLGKKVTGEHYGTISFKDGQFEVKNGKIVGGFFHIDMTSIVNEDLKDATWNQKLVGHLKSDDFFSVEKYQTSKLVLTKVTQDGDSYIFGGDLTIKGISEPVEFSGNVSVHGNKVTADGKIIVDRTKYDVRYGSGKFFSDLGDKMIDDNFTLDFNLVAEKK